ncbi:hypothetical protein SAMN04488515_0599 [Cognatiyoonia koreensis]|uniref:7-cyano-7-deazaguanine synthase (Queuosine biosynthesis) n=1 Tax=Cognatiyoonia koreensis TaxID=364200 RepID=A0A1I0NGB3_9RHOB|nr:hypothetical protein [Cognatiyoonia koreensis]SEW00304.1 hypothetical protein SAMN04488515_0599 [Cognatiyoonia koreensis]
MDITVKYKKGRADLIFGKDPAKRVYFQCAHPDHRAPVVWDFAAFAAQVIAQNFETDVTLHAAVTQTATQNCGYLSEFHRMARNEDTAYRVRPTTIVPDQPATGDIKALCLSTGIDSTYALVSKQAEIEFTHAMVVHGADYRPSHKVGFQTLLNRVTAMSDIAGLKPVVVKTNLRRIGFDWRMHHIGQLAACMHFLGPQFSDVAFAADKTIAQDLIRFPWGNNFAIGTHVGSGTNTTHYIGKDTTRYHKVKAIQKDARFLNHIGVCAAQKEQGGNCGVCSKCVMTRVAFECGGMPCPPIFKAMPDLAKQITALSKQRSVVKSRGAPIRAGEMLPYITDPELRAAVIAFRDASLQTQRPYAIANLFYALRKRLGMVRD